MTNSTSEVLDDKTERRIALVIEVVSFASFGTGGKGGIDEATNALRNRIRELQAEARKEGVNALENWRQPMIDFLRDTEPPNDR